MSGLASSLPSGRCSRWPVSRPEGARRVRDWWPGPHGPALPANGGPSDIADAQLGPRDPANAGRGPVWLSATWRAERQRGEPDE